MEIKGENGSTNFYFGYADTSAESSDSKYHIRVPMDDIGAMMDGNTDVKGQVLGDNAAGVKIEVRGTAPDGRAESIKVTNSDGQGEKEYALDTQTPVTFDKNGKVQFNFIQKTAEENIISSVEISAEEIFEGTIEETTDEPQVQEENTTAIDDAKNESLLISLELSAVDENDLENEGETDVEEKPPETDMSEAKKKRTEITNKALSVIPEAFHKELHKAINEKDVGCFHKPVSILAMNLSDINIAFTENGELPITLSSDTSRAKKARLGLEQDCMGDIIGTIRGLNAKTGMEGIASGLTKETRDVLQKIIKGEKGTEINVIAFSNAMDEITLSDENGERVNKSLFDELDRCHGSVPFSCATYSLEAGGEAYALKSRITEDLRSFANQESNTFTLNDAEEIRDDLNEAFKEYSKEAKGEGYDNDFGKVLNDIAGKIMADNPNIPENTAYHTAMANILDSLADFFGIDKETIKSGQWNPVDNLTGYVAPEES
jgi:hypothetical protein